MDFLIDYKIEIDKGLETFFSNYPHSNFSDSEQKLFDGCKYAVMQGGKRIRPVLGLMVYEVLQPIKNGKLKTKNKKEQSSEWKTIVDCLISLELMHASSLVHDDLPAMDNDLLRRGNPTVWKAYGEAEAILIGDMLITMAFENLANKSPNFCIKKLINVLAHSSGNNGMIGGQIRDIDSGNQLKIKNKKLKIKDNLLKDLELLHAKKTGALLIASAQFGAILAQVSSVDYEKITKYAQKVGLAFQIKDDLLDAEGDVKTVGKKVGKDLEKGFVVLMGLRQTKEKLKRLIDEAVEIAENFKSEKLAQLARFVGEREH